MYAKRFRLDSNGNLLADRLFCRVRAHDPQLRSEAARHVRRHRLELRAERAQAAVAFEMAWAEGDLDRALEEAQAIHSLMLAQRYAHEERRQSQQQRRGLAKMKSPSRGGSPSC